MPKYLKVTLSIIITSIVLPIILFGTCFAAAGTDEGFAIILGMINIVLIIIAPFLIIGSIIAIIVCKKKKKKKKENDIERNE